MTLLSYHSSNLSLIVLKTVRLLVRTKTMVVTETLKFKGGCIFTKCRSGQKSRHVRPRNFANSQGIDT